MAMPAPMTGSAAPATDVTEPRKRLGALDGLRGVAALIVVIHHTLLTSAPLAQPYEVADPSGKGEHHGIAWLFLYTPLHLVWDGTQAVFIFFILSGYVLALPIAQRGSHDWAKYYPKRLVRLYLPVWGAVLLALVLDEVVHRHEVAGGSLWLSGHRPPTLHGTVEDLVLLSPSGPGYTNTAFWSLRWEMWFSLALPLFVLYGAKARRAWLIKLVLPLPILIVGIKSQHAALGYLPMFAIGVVMAFERDRLSALTQRARTIWKPISVVALVVFLFLINFYWQVASVTGSASVLAVASAVEVAAAAGILLLVVEIPAIAGVLERKPVKWLGKRSFSLYLVHEPLVVSLAYLVGGRPNPALLLLLTLPLSLLLAEVFFRYVERPSHKLSKRAGAAVVARRAPQPA